MEKKKIIVLFGGRSGEHEVSLRSAASVISALDKNKYQVVPVLITREGSWIKGVFPEEAPEAEAKGVKVFLPADPCYGKLASLKDGCAQFVDDEADVVIPVLHGTFGEDGTVQGLLELANIPYVGAGVLGSALGMDKVMMKTVLAYHGIPQPKFVSCIRKDVENNMDSVITEIESKLGYPCFIKPANLGSSVGITKAHHREELKSGLNFASSYDRKIIIEEFVDAREVEVSVLGNDSPIASMPGEIVPLKEFYDYEAKYTEGLSDLKIPADLPPNTVASLQKLAVKVFKALDCAGMARVDFFLIKADGSVMVNEINTLPGFTSLSMYPKLWEVTGISYPDLLDRLINLAIERHRDKNRNVTTYEHS
ncbi:MAG: D-alanine--D-alanine ligase [Bacillota bacterium]